MSLVTFKDGIFTSSMAVNYGPRFDFPEIDIYHKVDVEVTLNEDENGNPLETPEEFLAEHLLAVIGNLNDVYTFVDWYKHARPNGTMLAEFFNGGADPNFVALVYETDTGYLWRYTKDFIRVRVPWLTAIGTGYTAESAALGAMYAGASSADAFTIASKISPEAAGPSLSFDTSTLRMVRKPNVDQ